MDGKEHVSERFARLLTLYRRPDGSEWGGQDLARATGGAVTRSYVANLKKGRVRSPGLDKLAAIAGATGFPPQLWFGGKAGEGEGQVPDAALGAAWGDDTLRAILEEALKLGERDRRLLLGTAPPQVTGPGGSPRRARGRGSPPGASGT